MAQDKPRLPDIRLVIRNSAGMTLWVCYEDADLNLKNLFGATEIAKEKIRISIKKRGIRFSVDVLSGTKSLATSIIALEQRQTIKVVTELEFSVEHCS